MSRLTTRVPMNREHPGVPRDAMEDVFITPRVLDKSAFDQFASTLKSLIEQAQSNSETLRKATAAAEAVVKQFGQTGPVIESRLQSATQVLASMEARTGDLQALTKRLDDRAAAAQKLEAQIDAIVSQRLADFEQRLSGRLQDATAKIDQARNDLAVRASKLQESLQHTIAQAQERLGGIASAAESEVAQKRASIDQHLAELETRLTRISEDMTKFAGPGLTALSSLCDRAERLLGGPSGGDDGDAGAPREGSAADTLAKLQASQRDIQEHHERLRREIESLREQAQVASKSLAQAIEGSASKIDELSTRQERVAAALDRTHATAESLDRRRDHIKSTMLEALSLAESVQQAVNEQLFHAREQLSREVDIMRETLLAAAMAHGRAETQTPMPVNVCLETPSADDLASMPPRSAVSANSSIVVIEEPKPTGRTRA